MIADVWTLDYSRDPSGPNGHLQCVLIDHPRCFDAANFLRAVDRPERWTVASGAPPRAMNDVGTFRMLIRCWKRRPFEGSRALAELSSMPFHFRAAFAAANVDLSIPYGFDCLILSEERCPWLGALLLFRRDCSQLIGADFADQLAMWRGRRGQFFRLPQGADTVTRVADLLLQHGAKKRIASVHCAFEDWPGDGTLDRIDNIASQLSSYAGDADLSVTASAPSGRERDQIVELVILYQ